MMIFCILAGVLLAWGISKYFALNDPDERYKAYNTPYKPYK